MNRPLTDIEEHLLLWMLEHGASEAKTFLPQVAQAEVTPWRCPCGCGSIEFSIAGHPTPSGSLQVAADFLFGTKDDLSGIFVFVIEGVLAGIDVYGLAGDAPKSLPTPDILRPFKEEL